MAIDNLFITYREHRKDMRAFPVDSAGYKRAKERLNEFLKYVKEKHGQDVVDTITSEQ
jgi:hypothetical protein